MGSMVTQSGRRAGDLDFDTLVQDDRLHSSIYSDQRIFDLEMERIFERTWVFIAHESEVPNAGDFKSATIGRQPIIVSRTESGELVGLYNHCTHRGAVICRAESGNTNVFRCPYHGWTFRNTGELIGVTRRQRYPADFDLHELDAVRVPRLESYRGLIFASSNAGVEPLVDYLAQARHWIDRQLDLALDGTIALTPGPHRHTYNGNWKFQAENGVDGYHAVFLHESFFSIQRMNGAKGVRVGPRDEDVGFTMAFDNGHALLGRHLPQDQQDAVRANFPGYFEAVEAKLGKTGLSDVLTQMNLFIFPNLYMLLNQIRVITPVSPTETLVTIHPVFLNGAPDALNEQRLREHEMGFSPTGFIGPDDYAAFDCVVEGLNAHAVPWFILKRGEHDERIEPDGSRLGSGSDETPQRGIYRRYRELMNATTGR